MENLKNVDISKICLQILDFAERYPFVKVGLVCLTFALIYKIRKEVGEAIYLILHR